MTSKPDQSRDESDVDSAGSEEVPPDPAALIESMRAVGYDLPTAVADLIDNSIAARSTFVKVIFDWDGPQSTMAVVDNGKGMTEEELVAAMRLGSTNPVLEREADDLGRFGLGLKSAGWSQARILTVASRVDGGAVAARCWNLDHVNRVGSWALLTPSEDEISRYAEMLHDEISGTVVLLNRLDRLVGDEPREDRAALTRFTHAVDLTGRHLAMVFHRFLAGRNAIRIEVNGNALEPWDPFMTGETATQRLPRETFTLNGSPIEVSPYVLPHFSKLSQEQHDRGKGMKGWNAHQGFYVYRAKRLLVAGGWLDLRRMQQEEHLKLARIQVDIDNRLDLEWQIDVKKETAAIPGPLVKEFRRIAEATRRRASDAYRFRGKSVARTRRGADSIQFVWERVKDRDTHRFRVNREHPVIADLRSLSREQRTVLDKALRLVEENIPVEAIVMEAREEDSNATRPPFHGKVKEVQDMLADAQRALSGKAGIGEKEALAILANVEPFDSFPELIQSAMEELEQ